MVEIRRDDLAGEATRALLVLHLNGMHAASPPGTNYALDLSGLRNLDITVWTIWDGGDVMGIGALKRLDDSTGEVKSMRTHPDHLRKGVAARLLDHMIAEAKTRRWTQLSLETGTGPVFEPALALYLGRGFVDGEAFSDYRPGAFNQFLHLRL
jgi:putative acetyltransferase